MKTKRHKFIISAIVILLLIPLLAMQFTDEVSWTIFDFGIMGVLLLGTGLLCERSIMKVTNIKHRIVLFIGILAGFLIVWAELAVGIFGTPFSGS
jgi:hypothetical protein